MQIDPPYGFKEIVPLTKTQRVVLPKGRAVPPLFRSMNPMPVSYSEFPAASHDYPLVFTSNDDGTTFSSMVVLGLDARQNIYITPANDWADAYYIPAYLRRYPFCMTRLMVDGKESRERLACVEKGAISTKGDRLFDEKGEPMPDWARRQKLLFDYEADLARSEEMCRLLAQHGLLEPFVVQFGLGGDQSMQLTGMYRVSEVKLHALPGAVLQHLVQSGVLGRIYAHLLSLENFNRLAARRELLQTAKAPVAPPPRRAGKMTVHREKRAADRRKTDSTAAAAARKVSGLPERRKGDRRSGTAANRIAPKKRA
jgi:hypothetical protein